MFKVIASSERATDNLFSFILWNNNGENYQVFGSSELRKKYPEGSVVNSFKEAGFQKVKKLPDVPKSLIDIVFH
jgi:hypothetical protein